MDGVDRCWLVRVRYKGVLLFSIHVLLCQFIVSPTLVTIDPLLIIPGKIQRNLGRIILIIDNTRISLIVNLSYYCYCEKIKIRPPPLYCCVIKL